MACTNLDDKITVITGGSRGIGKAIAILLAKKGANVIICARKAEDLKIVSDLIRRDGGHCSYVVADISDEKQVDSLVEDVMRNYGRIDILVNNAGVGVYNPLIYSSLNDWESVINTNLKGPFLCSKAFVPFMIQQKKGYIINIASGAGKVGMKNLSVYCSSKFGLIGLTKAMQKELKEFGIDVLYLCPGYVKTSFFINYPTDFQLPSNAKEPDEVAKKVLNLITHQKKIKRYFSRIIGRVLEHKICP